MTTLYTITRNSPIIETHNPDGSITRESRNERGVITRDVYVRTEMLGGGYTHRQELEYPDGSIYLVSYCEFCQLGSGTSPRSGVRGSDSSDSALVVATIMSTIL